MPNTMSQPTPERIMQIGSGHWASRILASATHFGVFTYLSKGALTADEVAKRAGISARGAQALLDGALGLALVTKKNGKYENTPEAELFLVKGKPSFLGFVGVSRLDWKGWETFDDSVKSGTSAHATASYETADNPFWGELVTAIAPLGFPVAEAAGERLGIAKRGAFTMLDVGGGSGVYSVVWLGKNREGKATQLDWGATNQIAKEFVKNFGVADRFETIDANCLEADFGNARYDYGVYSHMAHGFSEEENLKVLKKFRKAIKPGGTLVIADFVLDDDRQGHPMALLFYSNMLTNTLAGRTYTEGEYRRWLKEAGFAEAQVQPLAPQPVTLVYGR
jgi:ubiquinone/menaquinone biosynthesis C-methylase UbiE